MICITIINSIGGTHHKPWLPEEVVLPRASSRSAADHEPHLGPRGRRPYPPHRHKLQRTGRAGGCSMLRRVASALFLREAPGVSAGSGFQKHRRTSILLMGFMLHARHLQTQRVSMRSDRMLACFSCPSTSPTAPSIPRDASQCCNAARSVHLQN